MKKKFILILLAIIGMFTITGCGKTSVINEDKSQYTSSQVIDFLEQEGYKFNVSERSTLSGINSRTIYVNHETNEIWIQKIIDPYIGTLYNWHNGDINDKYAEIKNTYKNDEEEQKQYKEYQKWLKYYNLTNKQIIDALDYYDENN